MKEVCFEISTTWGGNYIVGVDDGEGFIPKTIKPKKGYFEVTPTHGRFTVKVYGIAYAKFGDPAKLKTEPKVNLKVVE